MEAVTILRELWRRRVLVAAVAFAAVLVGFLLSYRVGLPPEPRQYTVGVATARVLVDTPQSQVIKVDPKGSDTLGLRASVLANLMVEGEARAAIARRAGLKPRQLKAVSELATEVNESGSEAEPVSTAIPDKPDIHMIRTRVIANPDGEQLPIIETDVQAPDTASATRLANATVNGLIDYLDTRAAADEEVEDAQAPACERAGQRSGRELGSRTRADGGSFGRDLRLSGGLRGHSARIRAGPRLARGGGLGAPRAE